MNESQLVATLAGIPMDQVKEFIRQYIELAMISNTIALWVSGSIFVVCAIGFARLFIPRNRYGRNDNLYTMFFWAGLIALFALGTSAWDRYKMTHYPTPWVLQDLRQAK